MLRKNKNIDIQEMLSLSKKLLARHPEWGKGEPESNIYQFAWLITEIGEVLDILKKKGVKKIMQDPGVREEMLLEIVDCYMYMADVLNRYRFLAEDFSRAYRTKMKYNFSRKNQAYWKSKSE